MKKEWLHLFLIGLLLSAHGQTTAQASPWTYVSLDSVKQKWGDWADPEWLRYFGLDFADVNQDGKKDVVSGRYIYLNPGGMLDGPWQRMVLDDNVDAIFALDVDGDPFADIIAQALPDVYWYEALDHSGTVYRRKKIAHIPATSHVNSQGFRRAQIVSGGREELLIAGQGNIYAITIPGKAETDVWPVYLIAENTSDEGIGVGDLDGDGWLDIVAGRRPTGEGEPKILTWFRNPGRLTESWEANEIGMTEHPIDRVEVADVDYDGNADIVCTEERYPGLEPDASLYVFRRNADKGWQANKLVTQYSMNSLDVADLTGDGFVDIVTNEHKGPQLELQIWSNDGKGSFAKQVIDKGKENHLGTRIIDIDDDGDPDIVGAAWDHYQWMHLWRNNEAPPTENSDLIKQDKSPPSRKSEGVQIFETHYQDREQFLIKTPSLTFYYDIRGGGFSRMIDGLGNDWIGFQIDTAESYPASAATSYRGIPNLVYGGPNGGAGHPGFDKCKSWIESDSTVVSESLDGKWRWRWTFRGAEAQLDILATDADSPYWFLYEGTPGGSYQPEAYIFGTDQSNAFDSLPDYFRDKGAFGSYRWLYVGQSQSPSLFFMMHLTGDNQPDLLSFLGNTEQGAFSEDGMTVFGFGRNEKTEGLLRGNHSFLIGIYPESANSKIGLENLTHYLEKRKP
jgi:hypothetical protein